MEKSPTEDIGWLSLADIFKSNALDIYRYGNSASTLEADLSKCTNYFQKLFALRKYYGAIEEGILECYRNGNNHWYNSYPTDWSRILTPIEQAAWQSIRAKGRLVLYPQYPVLKYVIDFANPGLKIGLELDGKGFHNEMKDRKRDQELLDAGWKIYRITGSEMMKCEYKEFIEIEQHYFETGDEDECVDFLSEWILSTGDGVIQAIKETYFHERPLLPMSENIQGSFKSFCHRTLENHTYL